jgi:hypothetical protein
MKNAVCWDVVSRAFITNSRFASIFRAEEIMRAREGVRQ